MFAALAFDRDPLQLQDVPAGIQTWFQVVGGLATLGLILWVINRLANRKPLLPRENRPTWEGALFVTGLALSAVLYIFYAVLRGSMLMGVIGAYFSNEPPPEAEPATPFALSVLTLAGACALFTAAIPFAIDIARMRWRRIWALARLSFKEAIRRRVLWVFLALLLVFLFGSWFLPYDELKPSDQVRNYVTVVYWAMTPILLVTASLLAAFSIPTDIKQQTIHTILTKPVERFEIVLGRFIGYVMLMTVVLVVITAVSLLYVVRGVTPEAAAESFKARVPVYGALEFTQGGVRREKAENVGREWDYRSYISGPMPQQDPIYAEWTFRDLPTNLASKDRVRCEFHFDIYRTTKGEEYKGVTCSIYAQTWRCPVDRLGNPLQELQYDQERTRLLAQAGKSEAEIDAELCQKYGFFKIGSKQVYNDQFLSIEIPGQLFRTLAEGPDAQAGGDPSTGSELPPLRMRVRCTSPTQFLGMAKYDLWLRGDDPDSWAENWWFAFNFFKASAGLWLRLCLVIGVAVACSTYLTGVISWLATMFLFIAGMFRDFVRTVAEGTNIGGGPAEAFLRLVQRQVPASELTQSPTTQVASGTDVLFRWFFGYFLNVIPDVDRFDLTDKLREGFNISGSDLFVDLLLLIGYLLPWALVGYYLMKSREVAAST